MHGPTERPASPQTLQLLCLLAAATLATACHGEMNSGASAEAGPDAGSTSPGSGSGPGSIPGWGSDAASGWDSDAGSTVDPTTGTCASIPDTHEALIQLLAGPGYEHFHDTPGEAPPTIHQGQADGRYCYGPCNDAPVHWGGDSGQVLQVARDGSSTISRVRLVWGKHTGHGGSEYSHLYYTAPVGEKVDDDHDSWFTNPVDPGLEEETWLAASPVLEPVAVARGPVSWSNNGIVAFRSGLVGALGSGNNNDHFPFVMLPGDRLPTDVAVTNNGELALVTMWDTTSCTSELAVIALTNREGIRSALPNDGFYESMKLLGTIALPFARPTRVSAAVDFSLWLPQHPNEDAHQSLASQAGRDLWAASSDPQHSAASAGYAIVASRDEDKVAIVDLRPLMQYLRKMYFTTEENFRVTEDAGPADDQWPHTFAAAPESRPLVHATFDVTRPSALAAGYPVGDYSRGDEDFGWKAYVAREDGEIEVWDVGEVMEQGRSAQPEQIDVIPGCLNATRIHRGGRNGPARDTLAVACRGERAVLLIDAAGREVKRLQDSRFRDVVDATLIDSDGVEMVAVADFAGRRVLTYLNGPINAWGEELYGGLGPDGDDDFGFGGAWEGGSPFALSASMVP